MSARNMGRVLALQLHILILPLLTTESESTGGLVLRSTSTA